MRLYELVNRDVFQRGFEQSKKVGVYTLAARHGDLPYIPGKRVSESDQFRIEAKYRGSLVGWVNFSITDDALEAIDLVVNPAHRRKGLATEMYKFAKELGNSIQPSSKQTSMGKAFWSNRSISESTLKTDNPGGKWLEYKREDTATAGQNEHGAPARFGTTTGYFRPHVLMPVGVVGKIPGVMGEHGRTREDDLAWLVDYMGTNNHLPLSDSGKQYAPFIWVYQDGSPWVSEGNHRIKAAVKLGWKYIPIQLSYFNGAEEEQGILHPSKVQAWHSAAEAEGYSVAEFRGKQ